MEKPVSLPNSHKVGKVYQNPVPTEMMKPGTMKRVLWEMMNSRAERVPKRQLGPFKTDVTIYNTPPANGLRITWLGHSTLLIEIDGKAILTDPVWSKYVSPVAFAGPKRFFKPPIGLNQLPKLDLVLLSHDHYDHLDKKSIKKLATTDVPFFCSKGVAGCLIKWGVNKSRITELDWNESAKLGNDISITALAARHFSGRGINNRNETLWSSFVIKEPQHNIYFGADSGFWPGFEAIGEQYGPFDLTMLEIGAYSPYWPDIHMGPENAIKAYQMLKGKLLMPIHWGTFNLALHAWDEPIKILSEQAAKDNIKLFAPIPGVPTEVTEYSSEWWVRK